MYFVLQSADEVRLLHHYWYLVWPDQGVPSSPTELLDLVAVVRLHQTLPDSPMVIHCRLVCCVHLCACVCVCARVCVGVWLCVHMCVSVCACVFCTQ